MEGNLSQYISISNHQNVHFKFMSIYVSYVNYTAINRWGRGVKKAVSISNVFDEGFHLDEDFNAFYFDKNKKNY